MQTSGEERAVESRAYLYQFTRYWRVGDMSDSKDSFFKGREIGGLKSRRDKGPEQEASNQQTSLPHR